MKHLTTILLLLPALAMATGKEPPGWPDWAGKPEYNNTSVNVSNNNWNKAYSDADSSSYSKSSSLGVGTGTGSGSATINQGSVKVPNQAPAIYTTSAPSFSQRNCTPVGSVNASGPFGGLGVAFPMGGATCDAENLSDIIENWIRDSDDQKLWEVECQTLVNANDDLADAFEKVGYTCHDAYIKRQARVNSRAKMEALGQR